MAKNDKKAAGPIVITLAKAKETKGTFVFKNADAAVSSIYIDKEAFPDGAPESIKLTIEAA